MTTDTKKEKVISEKEILETPEKETPELIEEKDEAKRFQWIKGEDTGNVEVFSKTENKNNREWMIFESGRRIDSSVISEFMMEVAAGQELLLGNQQLNESAPVEKKKNPIKALLEMQQNTDTIPVSIDIDISVPTSELFEVLYNSFGDKFKEVLVEDILEKIDIENVSEYLRDSIGKELESRFNELSNQKPDENE